MISSIVRRRSHTILGSFPWKVIVNPSRTTILASNKAEDRNRLNKHRITSHAKHTRYENTNLSLSHTLMKIVLTSVSAARSVTNKRNRNAGKSLLLILNFLETNSIARSKIDLVRKQRMKIPNRLSVSHKSHGRIILVQTEERRLPLPGLRRQDFPLCLISRLKFGGNHVIALRDYPRSTRK